MRKPVNGPGWGATISSQIPHGFEIGSIGVAEMSGTPNAANIPGGRLDAVSWTDKSGNSWLFGGGGLDSADTFGYLNDLWEFDPTTSRMDVDLGQQYYPLTNGGQAGVYGTLNTPGAANTPECAREAARWPVL